MNFAAVLIRYLVLVYLMILMVESSTWKVPDNYSLLEPPCLPTKVNCIFALHQVKEISDVDHFVTLDVALYMNWTDPRFIDTESKISYSEDHLLNFVDAGLINDIWKPDLYFYNNREVSLVSTYGEPLSLEVYPATGEVRWWIFFRLHIDCSMHFDTFPLDNQRCPIILGSLKDTQEVQTFETDFEALEMIWQDRTEHVLQHAITVGHLTDEEMVNITFPFTKVH